jgi:hypothetical protein
MISNNKQRIQQILKELPDDCTIEDVQYHLYVVEKISNRLKSAANGSFVPQNDVERRLAKWLIP